MFFVPLSSRSGSLVFVCLLLPCCAASRRFDVSAPVTIKPRGIERVYWQGGERVDVNDMTRHLQNQAETKQDVARARTFSTFATLAAITGGALVGWPVGSAVTGQQDPLWILAGVGAGCIVLSISLESASSSSLESAVNTHNGLVRKTTARGASNRVSPRRQKVEPKARAVDGAPSQSTSAEPQPPQSPW